jgi:hypothetical protein
MEIGGPMSSLYLLGNPDHYTSHNFVPLFWKNYVREVMKAWKSAEDMDVDQSDKVLVHKSKDQTTYVGYSSVHDYIYRPQVHSDKTLYEWTQMAKKIKRPFKVKQVKVSDSDAENGAQVETALMQKLTLSEPQSDFDYDDFASNVSVSDVDFDNNHFHSDHKDDVVETNPGQQFLREHPLYETHIIQYNSRKDVTVPNFVGGSLPRRDFGDREYYCITMLTLFKPWRSGKDLKNEIDTWDETFTNHSFTIHQLKLMDNFNIRYECNDARDDFSTQLKKGTELGGIFPSWLTTTAVENIDESNCGDDFGNGEGDNDEDYGINKYTTPG